MKEQSFPGELSETDKPPLTALDTSPSTTHKLEIDPVSAQNRQWRCKCGYTLGDGRDKFLAPCPQNLATD